MLKHKLYTCNFCKTKPDQLSHHKSHLETQKHKDKKELFELKLSKLSSNELLQLHNTTDLAVIIDENETSLIFNNALMLDNSDSDEKLINIPLSNNVINTTNTMSQEHFNKIEQSNNVSNREALRDKIHEIHNFLRNNGAGYGMNALKVFNLLYGLKKLEEKKLLDKVNLKRPVCEFSYLLKLANENKDEELTELILGSVSTSIYHSEISEFLFYEIPSNIKSSVFVHLIKEINKITIIEKTCNVLLSGKIYEYFIGRDASAISELGAYFTDRHIVDYIYSKLNPKINDDGTIGSMIDMFGGSGGFTTGYINYLNNKYDDIDWETNINKIYHYDMNEDVIKSAALELFCLTGVLPNMKDNLTYKNSFTDEFEYKKFMNVITNPPYGGDKISKSDALIKRKKIIDYIKNELKTLTDESIIKTRMRQITRLEKQDKQEKIDSDKTKVSIDTCSQRIRKYAKTNKLTGNDKESASLILIMDMVDIGGTAIGVLKEGVFFNKTYKDIRKCLIENFNVREVISVPADQFENTSTKTSIVIFNNTSTKTSLVKFSDLVVERYTEDKFEEINGEIVLNENKDDICGISDKLISEATKDELLKNPIYSLNGKDYNKKEIIVGKGYELVKLGDISDINMGSTPSTANHHYWENGTIPWVSISELNNNIIYDTKKHITKEGEITMKNRKIPINSILLSFKLSIGKLAIAGVEMYCNEAIIYLNSKNKKIHQMYLYYILEGLELEKFGRGTIGSHGNLNKDILTNLQIPIPKSQQKITEWVDKISKPYDKKNKNEKLIMKLEEDIKNKIKDIEENEACDEVKIIDLCDIKSGKRLPLGHSYSDEPTLYYYLQVTNFQNNSIDSTNLKFINKNTYNILQKYDITENDIYISIAGTIGKVGIIPKQLNGSILTENAVRLTNIKINKIFLLYYLNLVNNELIESSNMSTIKKLSIQSIEKLKIKIPKDKKLIKDFEPLFEEIEKLQTELKEADSQYKQFIKELSEEAIPTTPIIDDKLEIISSEELSEVIEDKPKKKVVKRTSKTKPILI